MSNSLDGEEQLFSHKDAHLADAASGVERVRILLAQQGKFCRFNRFWIEVYQPSNRVCVVS
jgi:hypothetical protein